MTAIGLSVAWIVEKLRRGATRRTGGEQATDRESESVKLRLRPRGGQH